LVASVIPAVLVEAIMPWVVCAFSIVLAAWVVCVSAWFVELLIVLAAWVVCVATNVEL